MLSVFPSLLILGIFAPFILRLSVGVYFFYTGYRHIKEEREILVKEFANKFKTIAKPLVVIVAIIEMILGLSLVAGFLTQVAAILGMIFALKLLWFKDKYPTFAKDGKVFYALVFIILLSLLLTGAGAPAVDLPL